MSGEGAWLLGNADWGRETVTQCQAVCTVEGQDQAGWHPWLPSLTEAHHQPLLDPRAP